MLTSCRIVPELRNQLTFLLQLLKVFMLYQCAMLTGFTEDISVSMRLVKICLLIFLSSLSIFQNPLFSSKLFILFLKL